MKNFISEKFVEHYLLLGVDKIFIYDNNNIGDVSFENILYDFIRINLVEIIDVKGLSSIQIPI